ncbi:MAG: Undecaprenyl-diphosphatase [Alphaproteobacteria bacterium MarineAlpha3_Bin5]|mgnify:CR=1 FL=1|nr:undecaprenyl-diphosphatase [Magnetovibrio sp.]PPR79605.1 MAG: Undecaprenyl-diphosphatase [Alphaproteobacteria bacterium MarineAlpha3_Bin5]
MPTLQLFVLALVQGITEFLPISSSGHLLLVPLFTGWPDQGLIIDVAVHVGSLAAVIIYCWRDLLHMMLGLVAAFKGKITPHGRILGFLLISTIPIVVAGYFLNKEFPNGIRNLELLGWATLLFGIILYISDKVGMTIRRLEHLTILDSILIGCAQVLALIPGTSRAGITITIARISGFERKECARFSMLLAIPVILGAGSLKGWDLYMTGNDTITITALIAGCLAFLSALITIWILMLWLQKSSYTPFAVYRILLGILLLAISYS